VQSIRAITLDLDDTLWAIGPVISRAESELWQWLSEHYPRIPQRVSPQDLLEVRLQIADEYPEKRHDFRFLRRRTLAKVAIDSGYGDELVEAAFEIFDVARNRIEFFPDVLPALESLSTRYRLVAVTNGNANLLKIGIRHLFHDVVTAVDAGVAKPAEPIFAEAARRAGVQRDSILHVGDHPEIDVEGARSAGLRSAWMNRIGADWPAHLPQPDVVLTSMSDLHDLLDAGKR
jgi:putative hydrolase of the HAD superfamily